MSAYRHLLAIVLNIASVSLGGCAIRDLQNPVPPIASNAASWTSPLSKRQSYLYAGTDSTLAVFTYPGGSLVGQAPLNKGTFGLCSDSTGNVWVVTGQNDGGTQVTEFPHGGTAPVAVINGPGYDGVGCSVDPTTGNLAVSDYDNAGFGSRNGTVVIFPKPPKYPPKAYKSPRNVHFLYCTYDSHGNLFVDGLVGRRQFAFFELAKGASTFQPITLDRIINHPGAVQWDGQHVALADAGTQNIYQFTVANGSGTEVGATTLSGTESLNDQFWIQGGTVIYIPLVHSQPYGFGFWKYPQGGSPIQTFTGGDFRAFTISR